jgi:hypothetical protein
MSAAVVGRVANEFRVHELTSEVVVDKFERHRCRPRATDYSARQLKWYYKVHVQRAHGNSQAAVVLQKKASEDRGSSDHKSQAIQKAVQLFARQPDSEVQFFFLGRGYQSYHVILCIQSQ